MASSRKECPTAGATSPVPRWAGALAMLTLCPLLLAAELHLTIQDASGRPVAAAVQLHDRDGKLHVPDDAVDLSGMGYLYGAGNLIHYADWTSPRARSQYPCFGSSWFRQQHAPESSCFFVDGELRVPLEVGTYRLRVSKGLEYIPFERILTIGEADQAVTVPLARWVDMAARGWYSGDGHVHIERTSPAANRNAFLWARAEDVRVCNVLGMGDARQTYYPQYALGPSGRAESEATWLIPGQEDPRTTQLGHTLHLNTTALLRDPDNYYSYGPIFAGNRGAGLSGFAHVGRRRWHFQADRGLTLLAPAGLVDFVEIAQMGYVGVERWFEFLNLGFRLTAMAGSDVPWGGTIGSTRAYAHTGDAFDADSWIEAVRQGRTFVTTGPMLELAVNGRPPGTVLAAGTGDRITVKARAWGELPGRQPVRLKLVSFGQVLKEVSGPGALELSAEIHVERSCWVTAVCETNDQPLMDAPGYFSGAVATPVYIEVGGRPAVHRAQLASLVERRLQTLREIERWLDAGTGVIDPGGAGGWESPEAFRRSIPEIRSQVQAARSYFRAMIDPVSNTK